MDHIESTLYFHEISGTGLKAYISSTRVASAMCNETNWISSTRVSAAMYNEKNQVSAQVWILQCNGEHTCKDINYVITSKDKNLTKPQPEGKFFFF